MDIKIEFEGLDKVMQMLSPGRFNEAMSRSLNDSAKAAKTVVVDSIYQKYNIKKKDIRKNSNGKDRFRIGLARKDNLVAELNIYGRPISLSKFGAKWFVRRKTGETGMRATSQGIPYKVSRRGKSGVEVKILRGGKKTFLKHSFLAKMPSGHLGVMHRKTIGRASGKWGQKELPIYENKLMSIPTMANQPEVKKKIEKRVNEYIGKRFYYHFKNSMKK